MRRWRAAVAVTAVVVAVTVVPATPTYAADPPVSTGATAFSAGATTGSAKLSANLHLTGAIGGLLDALISPIVNNALNPLVNVLQTGFNSLIYTALGAASPLHADTPATQSGSAPGAFPTETFPSPCVTTGPIPCYKVINWNLNAAPWLSAGVGFLRGWTQQVPVGADPTNPIIARAQVSSNGISALMGITSIFNPIVSTGQVDAKATCPNDGNPGATRPKTAPSAQVQSSGLNLLGGLIKFSFLNGNLFDLTVAGTNFTLQSLGVVSLPGVTVTSYGNAIMATIPLSIGGFLGTLGLDSSIVNQLLGYGPTSTLALRIVVGPGMTVTANSAYAYGLGIGIDLSGSLNFDLLGLVGATVTIPTGIGGGNLGNIFDLREGTVSCASGTGGLPPSAAIPPSLV